MKVINPLTNRKIESKSNLYKNLLKKGYVVKTGRAKIVITELGQQYIENKRQQRENRLQLRRQAREQERENRFNDKITTLKNDISRLLRKDIEKINVDLTDFKKNNTNVKKLLSSILNVSREKQILLNFGGVYYTLSHDSDFYNNLLQLLTEGREEVRVEGMGSDALMIRNIVNFESFDVELLKPRENSENIFNRQRPGGRFFRYLHTIQGGDFSRYGVYDVVKASDLNSNCLIRALAIGGLSDVKLNYVVDFVKNNHIPQKDIHKICEKLNISIHVKTTEKKRGFIKYGTNKKEIYNIGLIEEHYFIIEPVEFTKFSILNYQRVKHINGWNKIYKHNKNKGFKKSNNKFTNSYELIKCLLKNKDNTLRLISYEDNEIFNTDYLDKVEKFTNLKYDPKCASPYEQKEPKPNTMKKIFLDFETHQHGTNNRHIPYLGCYADENGNKRSFVGDYYYNKNGDLFNNVGQKILNSLTEDCLIIIHNAKYDLTFLTDYVFNLKKLEKDGTIYQSKFMFKNKNKNIYKFVVKDSYKLISKKLSEFPKMFFNKNEQEKIIKEVMPYDLYNYDAVNKRYVKIEEAIKHLKKCDVEQFKNNIIKWDLTTDNIYFDCVEYSKQYCLIDCEILKKGYEQFKIWINDITKMDIDNILTISGLGDRYAYNGGSYNDICEFSGVVREFIQQSCVGGRCMVSNNKKKIINDVLDDFDAVSLYPSALFEMSETLGGFLKGKPKIIKTTDYEEIKKYDGYFIEVEIKKVNKYREFPLLSYKNEKGIRCFTNDMVGRRIILNKISLEDAIAFQDIEFEIIKGYYFDEGRTNNIKNVIKHLFESRQEAKKKKNPIQEVYKLIMNAIYGKNILKPSANEIKTFNNLEMAKKYASYNYAIVKELRPHLNNKCDVKITKTINDHFNRCHVGSEILAYSKRLMYRVMCLAEDNNIEIYYQDTDSMHIKKCDIEKLSRIYEETYNKTLIGKELGQFHCDFDDFTGSGNEVYAVESIFLTKKIYYDLLESKDKDGNIQRTEHFRLKGVKGDCIRYTAHKMGVSIGEIYKKLYNGETIKFNLLKGMTEDGHIYNVPSFEYKKNGQVYSRSEFERKIKI